jgi:choline-glycine betaine transporter
MKNILAIFKLAHFKKGVRYLSKLMKYVILAVIASILKTNNSKIILSTIKFQTIL